MREENNYLNFQFTYGKKLVNDIEQLLMTLEDWSCTAVCLPTGINNQFFFVFFCWCLGLSSHYIYSVVHKYAEHIHWECGKRITVLYSLTKN